MNKQPCDRCGEKNQTEVKVFSSGATYRNTNCNNCGRKYGILMQGGEQNQAVQGEWTRHANSEKEAHSADILQPIKKDGTINKDFVKVHGTKSISKELKLTPSQIWENVERYG